MKAWRKEVARGEVMIVRYAGDGVLGFGYREDAAVHRKTIGEGMAAKLTTGHD